MDVNHEEPPPGSDARRIAAEEHMAIRLNDMDLQRAVEQVAILVSLFAAVRNRSAQRGTPAKVALASMMGYLSHAWCRGRVMHPDYKHGKNDLARKIALCFERINRERASSAGGVALPGSDATFGIAPADGDWDLHFVLSPLDGSRSFFDGHDSGSISILGAGRPGAFVAEDGPNELADDYLVVTALDRALPDRSLRDLARAKGLLRDGWTTSEGGLSRELLVDADRAASIAEVVERQRQDQKKKKSSATKLEGLLHGLVEMLHDELASQRLVRSWATSSNGGRDFAFNKIRPALLTRFKLRTFNGSSVAAGMLPLFPHVSIDGYVGVIRRTQVILLAIAVQATNGRMLAIPVTRKEKKTNGNEVEDYDLCADRPVLEADDFVRPEHDVFLLATGVSENLLVRGVRFRTADQVSTQTLCLRTATRSSRIITHHHDLRKKQFRLLSRAVGPRALEDLFGRVASERPPGFPASREPLVLDRLYAMDPDTA